VSADGSKWVRRTAVFLAVAYGVGAPVSAVLELRSALLSQRFLVPPALIYTTCAVQLACAAAILSRRYARGAAAVLTVTTLGATGAHLKIGSPLTALPAVAFTVLQVWFVFASPRGDSARTRQSARSG
jgi:hypothetical protein